MRDYPGFSAANLSSAIDLLTNVYWPSNHDFLQNHLNQTNTHYWANWDLCNMASALSIGIVADDSTIYNYALDYFHTGIGNGQIDRFLWVNYTDGTSQLQEVRSLLLYGSSDSQAENCSLVEIRVTRCWT